MGALIALVPVLAWGNIGLVGGKTGGDTNQQVLGMTIDTFPFSLTVFSVASPVIIPWIFLIELLSDLTQSVRQNRRFHGVKYMGASIGLPLSTGFRLILNTIAGTVFSHEWAQAKDRIYGIIVLALLVGDAYLIARQDDEGEIDTDNKMLDFGKGFRALIFSATGYGVYTAIVNQANLDAMSITLSQSIGMTPDASFFAFRKIKVGQSVWKNMICGLLWGLGDICMLLTVKSLGSTVGPSLSQTGIIISTLGGIFVSGGRKTKKGLIYAIVGCLLIILGDILLGYMKTVQSLFPNLEWEGTSMDLFYKKEISLNHTGETKKELRTSGLIMPGVDAIIDAETFVVAGIVVNQDGLFVK